MFSHQQKNIVTLFKPGIKEIVLQSRAFNVIFFFTHSSIAGMIDARQYDT